LDLSAPLSRKTIGVFHARSLKLGADISKRIVCTGQTLLDEELSQKQTLCKRFWLVPSSKSVSSVHTMHSVSASG
jgi:hypothetical protein